MLSCAACGDFFESDEPSVHYDGRNYHDECISIPKPIIKARSREVREKMRQLKKEAREESLSTANE